MLCVCACVYLFIYIYDGCVIKLLLYSVLVQFFDAFFCIKIINLIIFDFLFACCHRLIVIVVFVYVKTLKNLLN